MINLNVIINHEKLSRPGNSKIGKNALSLKLIVHLLQ